MLTFMELKFKITEHRISHLLQVQYTIITRRIL